MNWINPDQIFNTAIRDLQPKIKCLNNSGVLAGQ